MFDFTLDASREILRGLREPQWVVERREPPDETERDRIPEALPEMDRAGDDAPQDEPDEAVASDAKPQAGQEPG